MTYAVSGIAPNGSSTGVSTTQLTLYDMEEAAKEGAETALRKGWRDVSVWQQLYTPRMETTIIWE